MAATFRATLFRPATTRSTAAPATTLVSGRGGNDTIYGDAGTDSINGGDGNDTLYGGADDDAIDGKAGDDHIYGGDGFDNLVGGEGDDVFTPVPATAPISVAQATTRTSSGAATASSRSRRRRTQHPALRRGHLGDRYPRRQAVQQRAGRAGGAPRTPPRTLLFMTADTFKALERIEFADGSHISDYEITQRFVIPVISSDNLTSTTRPSTLSFVGATTTRSFSAWAV